jgi:nitrogen fixation protein FixH
VPRALVPLALLALSGCDAGVGLPDGGGGLAVSLEFQGAAMHRVGNVLEVAVAGADGGPVAGAAVLVSLWMPTHGHGAPAPAVTEASPGHYQAAAVDFTMAGTWQVTARATAGPLGGSQALEVAVP